MSLWTKQTSFPGSNKSFCFESCLRRGVGLRVWHEMVSFMKIFLSRHKSGSQLKIIFIISFKTNPLRYPFDTQSCVMVFECEGNSGEFVQLVPQHLEYLGPKDLTQYFIRWKELTIRSFRQKLINFQMYDDSNRNVNFFRQTSMTQSDERNIEVTVVLGRWKSLWFKFFK